MDEISKAFLAEVDKLSIKFHRQIKLIVKFDEVKGVYPAYRIVEYIPSEITEPTKSEDLSTEIASNEEIQAKMDEEITKIEEPKPQGQMVEVVKKENDIV